MHLLKLRIYLFYRKKCTRRTNTIGVSDRYIYIPILKRRRKQKTWNQTSAANRAAEHRLRDREYLEMSV